MAHAELIGSHWDKTVEQLGGARLREADLLQFVLAYCLGKFGLRLTAASADRISNVALSRGSIATCASLRESENSNRRHF